MLRQEVGDGDAGREGSVRLADDKLTPEQIESLIGSDTCFTIRSSYSTLLQRRVRTTASLMAGDQRRRCGL
jgi:hypothetical protein